MEYIYQVMKKKIRIAKPGGESGESYISKWEPEKGVIITKVAVKNDTLWISLSNNAILQMQLVR